MNTVATSISVRAADSRDAAAIADIYNQGIADRGATFETSPRSSGDMLSRLADTRYPLLVAVDDNDTGFVLTAQEVDKQMAKVNNQEAVPTGKCISAG